MKHIKLIVSAVLLLIGTAAKGEVKLASFFSDNMVLQQQTQCNLWGKATPGKAVTIRTSWDQQTYRVTADRNGSWKVQVQTTKAGGPYVITFNDGQETCLKNILLGEVWICSGQSNMEMPVGGFKAQPVEGAHEEILFGADSRMRFFTVKRNAQLEKVDTVNGRWSEATPETIRDFSATAYFFGKTLRRMLNCPVGLIVTCWGGSACEAWMKADWLKAFPTVKLPSGQADVDKRLQRCPSALYNGMLFPLIGYTMRGVIWYQGEDNVSRYANYADLFTTMIKGWRDEWKQGSFPFYYCQIAPYSYNRINWSYNSAFLREQQLKAEKMTDNARMAVLMDTGLEYGIHPRKKREAGERLAMLALGNTYGVKGMPEFATYSKVVFRNDTADISFDRSRQWVYMNNGPQSDLFEVAGADKVFHPAKAWVSRNHVFVKSEMVKEPVAVRYAFKDWAVGDLFHDGLPVSSFRTDTWDDVQ